MLTLIHSRELTIIEGRLYAQNLPDPGIGDLACNGVCVYIYIYEEK